MTTAASRITYLSAGNSGQEIKIYIPDICTCDSTACSCEEMKKIEKEKTKKRADGFEHLDKANKDVPENCWVLSKKPIKKHGEEVFVISLAKTEDHILDASQIIQAKDRKEAMEKLNSTFMLHPALVRAKDYLRWTTPETEFYLLETPDINPNASLEAIISYVKQNSPVKYHERFGNGAFKNARFDAHWSSDKEDDLRHYGIFKSSKKGRGVKRLPHLTYDPKVAKRQLEKIKRAKDASRNIPKARYGDRDIRKFYFADLMPLYQAMTNHLARTLGWYMFEVYGPATMNLYSRDIMSMVFIFEGMFGKKSYRKVPEFQQLKRTWKKFNKSGWNTNCHYLFKTFMDKEMKVRSPNKKLMGADGIKPKNPEGYLIKARKNSPIYMHK